MDPSSIHYYRKNIQGSQGIVGECMYKGETCVFKKSNTVDHIVSLEYDIMKCLDILPHFCKVRGYEDGIVFMKKYNKTTLGDLIYEKSPRCSSIIQQTMIAILCAQQMVKFTHYDLHTDNILLESTPYDYHTYILPSGDQYTIKTHGISPVIIDFGYSYADGLTPYRTILEYMSEGYTTYEYDHLADMRLFVTTLIYDMTKYYPTHPCIQHLKPMFKHLHLDHKSGWYHKGVFNSALSQIKSKTPTASKSNIFNKSNINGSIELFNHMINLPLTTPSTSVSDGDYKTAFKTFLKDWVAIEKGLESKREMRKALIVYLEKHSQDDTIQTIVNKIQEILWNIQMKNKAIRDNLYSKLSITSIKDILNKLIEPCDPTSDNIKVFDFHLKHECNITEPCKEV